MKKIMLICLIGTAIFVTSCGDNFELKPNVVTVDSLSVDKVNGKCFLKITNNAVHSTMSIEVTDKNQPQVGKNFKIPDSNIALGSTNIFNPKINEDLYRDNDGLKIVVKDGGGEIVSVKVFNANRSVNPIQYTEVIEYEHKLN